MRVDQDQVGNVVVLHFEGNLTLGEDCDCFGAAVQPLIASGATLIVFDLAEVPYIDSSGLAVITRNSVAISRAGGRLWLMDPSQRIRNLLNVTKLESLFDFITRADLPALQHEGPLRLECPICSPPGPLNPVPKEPKHGCSVCGLQVVIIGRLNSEGTRLFRSTWAAIPTYEGENIVVTDDPTGGVDRDLVTIPNRLDLFVSEVVERLWAVLPPPRRVIFSARHAMSSETGLRKLISLCRPAGDGSVAALIMDDMPPATRSRFEGEGALIINSRDTSRPVPGYSRKPGLPLRMWRP